VAEGLGMHVHLEREDFEAALDRLIDRANLAVRAAVEEGINLLIRDAKLAAPVGKSSPRSSGGNGSVGGTLRRSISLVSISEDGPGRYTATAGPHVVYGRIRELGGTIRAKNAPYLKFQINGSWVQVKSVTQSGKPYMRPALEATAASFDEIMARKWREAMA
jgi:hypothetical protein